MKVVERTQVLAIEDVRHLFRSRDQVLAQMMMVPVQQGTVVVVGEVAAVVIDQYLVLRAAGQVVLRGGHTIAADLQAVTVTAIRQRETVRVV